MFLRADAPRDYVRAWTLCCFHSLISTHSFRRALTASMDSCVDVKSTPLVEYVTSFGRVWRKVMKTMLGVWVVLFCQAHQQFFTHSSDILVAELLLGSKE